MKIVLWILQGALAFLCFAGGAYKMFKPADLVATVPSLPFAGWRAFGAIEVVGALLLLLPLIGSWGQKFTPLAAGLIAAESLLLAYLYAQQSLAISVENPLVWAVVMALLAIIVGYARFAAR